MLMPVTTRMTLHLGGNPYKPSFVTVTGWGVDQRYSSFGEGIFWTILHESILLDLNLYLPLLLTQPMDPFQKKKGLNGLFSLLNISIPKKFKPFSHWPSKAD